MVLEVFAELAQRRPEVLVRLAKDRYSTLSPDDAAYEAQDLKPFGSTGVAGFFLPVISHG